MFGPLGLLIHDQIADDASLDRDLKRSKRGYAGPRITGDDAERDEAIKQFLGRVQKQKPPAEPNNSQKPISPAGESAG
jgi:hypothetical protein